MRGFEQSKNLILNLQCSSYVSLDHPTLSSHLEDRTCATPVDTAVFESLDKEEAAENATFPKGKRCNRGQLPTHTFVTEKRNSRSKASCAFFRQYKTKSARPGLFISHQGVLGISSTVIFFSNTRSDSRTHLKMVGRSLLLLAVVLCASPALNSPIEGRMPLPNIKSIFNSFRSNPLVIAVPASTTSKPTPATDRPTEAPKAVVVQKATAAQPTKEALQDSHVAGLVLAAQKAHAQKADVFTGKAAKPDNFGVAKNPRPSVGKNGNGKRKRRPGAANQPGKRRPAANHRPGNKFNAGAAGFTAGAMKKAQQALRPTFNMGAVKAGAPNRRRPGANNNGKKKGNKKQRRPQISEARRQMNQVMDQLFVHFSSIMESRVEPVEVKLASLAGRGNKIGKWAFIKARQTARNSRAEDFSEAQHEDAEVTTVIADEHDEVEHEVEHEVATENETQDKPESRTVEEHDEVAAHEDDDEEEDHDAVAEEDDAHVEDADDTKKTVVTHSAEIQQTIEKLAAAVQSHPDIALANPNILPDDNKEFTVHVSQYEKVEEVNPADISETPVGKLNPDGKVEYQLSLVEDDEDELIKAEEKMLAEKDAAEDRAGRPGQKGGNKAAMNRNKKKQKIEMRKRINMQRNRILKRENSLEYPNFPNAVLHGLSRVARSGAVRIKSNNQMRLISVPVKFGPLKMETTAEAEPALRNAEVTIPSLYGVLRLSERNGRIVDAKVMSAYLRPRRAIVTLTRSSDFDVKHENRRRQMARIVTHFSNQMARLWNAQSLLPKILTTEFQRAFTQPDVSTPNFSIQQFPYLPEIVDLIKSAGKPANKTKASVPVAASQPVEQVQEVAAVAQDAAPQQAVPVAPEAAAVPQQDQAQAEPAKPVDAVEAVQAIARVKLANKKPSTHVV